MVEAEELELIKIDKKMTGTLRQDTAILHTMRTFLKISVSFH